MCVLMPEASTVTALLQQRALASVAGRSVCVFKICIDIYSLRKCNLSPKRPVGDGLWELQGRKELGVLHSLVELLLMPSALETKRNKSRVVPASKDFRGHTASK